jgi:hypothetical protein
LPNIDLIIKLLVELVKESALSIEKGETLYKIDVELENNKVSSVHQIRRKDLFLNTIEILNSIFYFCSNEKMRREIFHNFDIKEDLKKILIHGKSAEVEYALKLILQFCFDEMLVIYFKEDSEFVQIIISILGHQDPNEKIIYYCKGIKFILNNKKVEADSINYSLKSIKKIFISHDLKETDVTIKIGDNLKMFDFKIWFKNKKIEKYELDETYRALKSSDCILLSKIESVSSHTGWSRLLTKILLYPSQWDMYLKRIYRKSRI